MTPSEVAQEIKPVSVCECTQEMTCSTFGTMSHWNGNVMQDEALRKIYRLEKPVKAAHDKDLTHVWRKLQSADHFHYMQKENSFTPYASAFDAYIYYMNALADLQIRVKENPENRFSRIRKKRPDLFSSEYCEPGWIIVCREHHGTVPGCKNFAVPECGLLCPLLWLP